MTKPYAALDAHLTTNTWIAARAGSSIKAAPLTHEDTELTWAQREWLQRVFDAGPEGITLPEITKYKRSFINATWYHNIGAATNSPLPPGTRITYHLTSDGPRYFVETGTALGDEALTAKRESAQAARPIPFVLINPPKESRR